MHLWQHYASCTSGSMYMYVCLLLSCFLPRYFSWDSFFELRVLTTLALIDRLMITQCVHHRAIPSRNSVSSVECSTWMFRCVLPVSGTNPHAFQFLLGSSLNYIIPSLFHTTALIFLFSCHLYFSGYVEMAGGTVFLMDRVFLIFGISSE